MARGDLTARIEVLEEKVDALAELPARVSSLEVQVLQLRTEMRDEFSVVRQEMRTLNEETRAEMRSLKEELRAEMRALNDHTLTQIRVLHEEVIDRIARLDDGGATRRSQRSRKRR